MPQTQGSPAATKHVLQLSEFKKLRKDDVLAKVVQDFFLDAKEYRQDFEDEWGDAYDAYHSRFPSRLEAIQGMAKDRGIWVNMTRRKVNNAKVKINSLLFESGKIPFSIKPNHSPRYLPKELRELEPSEIIEALHTRALSMEEKIRDILFHTDYFSTVSDIVLDMCLYGTGISKAVTMRRKNYPVFDAPGSQRLKEAEKQLESELLPVVEPVSVWDLFPSPECTSIEDAEYFIQRSYYSAHQLRKLGEQGGFELDKIENIISNEKKNAEGDDSSDSPARSELRPGERTKNYEILEFWGSIAKEDLEPYMNVPKTLSTVISVVITVLGDKVLRVVPNPFDGRTPFHFCYWQKNNDVIWGDGIYFNIRDYQAIANFTMAQIVEGKTISSNPMMVVDPMAFERGEDLKNVRPGKIFKVKPGSDVNQAFKPIVVPDVSNGLIDLFKLIERETDLDSGQTAIGAGETSSYQTRTATGMSILNSNSNKLTAEVVRSVSNMIQMDIEQIYYWLMADSNDQDIRGDFEAKSTGFIEYLSKEVHNTQLINMLQVFTQNPEMKEYVKYQELIRPIVRAFSMDPEELVFSAKEKEAKDMQAEEKLKQDEAEKLQKMEQLKDSEAVREEKKSVGEDARKSTMLERIELLKMGQMVREMPDYSLLSPLMLEEMQKEAMLMQEVESQKEDQMMNKQDSDVAASEMMQIQKEVDGQAGPQPQQGEENVGGPAGVPAGGANQPPGGPPV